MNSTRIVSAGLCLLLATFAPAPAQEMEKELTELARKLATLTAANAKKKVTVLDFTDLQGNASELGKYVAEELTVNLVMVKSNFAVLDRANLRKILAEHKLTTTGLVDPENAKKLGQFAGVDALILGTIIPKGQRTAVTAKIITTDTAEIVGASKAEFMADETVKHLESRPATNQQSAEETQEAKPEPKPKVIKTFGDLRVEIQSLEIVNGRDYRLTFQLANENARRPIYVAVRRSYTPGELNALITDAEANEYPGQERGVRGVCCGGLSTGRFSEATEIKPKESISASATFQARNRAAIAGPCQLQMEFLLGYDFSAGYGPGTAHNLVAKVVAE